ncbi:MAG: acetoacetate--CoA ligase [Nitrososphaerota archaeon]|nr:acetoacetate--CoA ligase [Nitrososphaerota archaeon]
MSKLLWKPSQECIENANIMKFIDFVNRRYGLSIRSYHELYEWSIREIEDFWSSLWDFLEIRASKSYEFVVDDLSKFPGARWFVGARLNFAENLLRFKDDSLAYIFKNELGEYNRITYAELYESVAQLANSLYEFGIHPNDRIAAYMPNIPETAIVMLATTSVGATFASCGTELGPIAVLDRLSQIEPKVLFAVDGYPYKGKSYNILPNVKEVAKNIPSLEKIVIIPYMKGKIDLGDIPNAILYDEFIKSKRAGRIDFKQVDANHPVYIMFSSGTTGKPKCMVQSVAGILINHLKELILHSDLKREDRITYITSPSWMMWHWLTSSLAVGSTIVIYDGNPFYPDWGTMWKLVQDERITIFGCSASYINALKSVNAKPGKLYDLSSLREISQTGSPLSAEGFEWVYENIKSDLWFNSISGGTDLNGCFFIGSPTLPVYAGQLQAKGLGMKVEAYDEKGNPIYDKPGELVCELPSPSMPIYFWNDPDNKKYLETYFEFYRPMNKNVWRHGDWITIHSDTKGVTIHGRSDATIKPSGVRIGTSEIYRVVEELPEVADSLAVGQNWQGDQRIILFVKLREGYSLTEGLKDKIKKALREKASPRHVPAKILEVKEIPYTMNYKKVEIAVTNLIHGRPITNIDALINPESLEEYRRLLPKLQED